VGVHILTAVVLAPASAVSYAGSAVLQQREASRQDAGGARLVGRLVRDRVAATAKLEWLGRAGAAKIVVALVAALLGVVMAQHAYRDGGLGAPLATVTLVDPLTAGLRGVLVLGEPFSTAPRQLALGAVGIVLVMAGAVLLVPQEASLPGSARAVLAAG